MQSDGKYPADLLEMPDTYRTGLVRLPMPFLRLYGRLDGLVPRKIVPLLDDLWPESESILFDKAAHAPFVSHPAAFCEPLLALKRRLG